MPEEGIRNYNELSDEEKLELTETVLPQNIDLRHGDFKRVLANIADNEQKINHHGKRADAIVKGMLQHSRSSSGVKEPTSTHWQMNIYGWLIMVSF